MDRDCLYKVSMKHLFFMEFNDKNLHCLFARFIHDAIKFGCGCGPAHSLEHWLCVESSPDQTLPQLTTILSFSLLHSNAFHVTPVHIYEKIKKIVKRPRGKFGYRQKKIKTMCNS